MKLENIVPSSHRLRNRRISAKYFALTSHTGGNCRKTGQALPILGTARQNDAGWRGVQPGGHSLRKRTPPSMEDHFPEASRGTAEVRRQGAPLVPKDDGTAHASPPTCAPAQMTDSTAGPHADRVGVSPNGLILADGMLTHNQATEPPKGFMPFSSTVFGN